MKRVIGALLILATAGCAKKAGDKDGGPTCEKLADHVVEIMKKEAAELPDGQRKALEAQLSAVRSEFIADCTKDSEAYLAQAKCILDASSSSELGPCEPQKSSP